MKDISISNAYFNGDSVNIRISSGEIVDISKSPEKPCRFIIPGGFMELHCHGACGWEMSDLNREAYEAMSLFMAEHGVTSFLATLSAAPPDLTLERIDFIKAIMDEDMPGARLDGIYLEGPFLKIVGGMTKEFLSTPSVELARKFSDAGEGAIKIMTLSPELPGTFEVIEFLAEAGIVAAAGHTVADAGTIRKAVEYGLSHITHLGNNGEGDISCRKGCYEHCGPLLEMLADDRLSAELIADGIHLAPELLKVFYRAKGGGNCAVISDGCAASGAKKGTGTFSFVAEDGKEKFFVENGALYISEKKQLCGSLVTMDRAFMNIRSFANLTPEDAALSCGAVPRRIAGLEAKTEIKPGTAADMAVLSEDGNVELTLRGGKIIYQNRNNRLQLRLKS